MTIQNRIIDHRKVRAGDILPHEMNPRTHTNVQRDALKALLAEIGFARSLLAYEVDTPTGRRLKLIDGHLRQSLDPEAEVTVEVLDVTDAEARALLLAIDPLAQLAGYDGEALHRLRELAQADSQAVTALWASIEASEAQASERLRNDKKDEGVEAVDRFTVVIDCTSERQQLDLLRRLRSEGLKVQAKTV